MGPLCHAGLTSALLIGTKIAGMHTTAEEILAVIIGGVLIDGDKIFEIWDRRIRKRPPDITARNRILHSVLVFPFALALSYYVAHSFLPIIAVLLHIAADSAIPGLVKDGKHYPSHSPWKWVLCPWNPGLWHKIVIKGWPIEYPPTLIGYHKLAETVGALVVIFSIPLFFIG